MTDDLKLLTCPFCVSDEQQWTGHYVECCNCHAQGPDLYPVPDDEKVKEYWNTRHESDEFPEWLGIILHNKLLEQTHTPVHSYSSGFYTALTWVLSLRKPETP